MASKVEKIYKILKTVKVENIEILNKSSFSENDEYCYLTSYLFRLPIIDKKYTIEPFPKMQKKMFEGNIRKAMRIAGTMYMKGMDDIFWSYFDIPNIKFLKRIFYGSKNLKNMKVHALIWTCVIIHKMYSNGIPLGKNHLEECEELKSSKVFDCMKNIVRFKPYYVSRQYFTIELKNREFSSECNFVDSNYNNIINVHNLGDNIVPSKKDYNEYINGIHRISDLGTIQIYAVTKRSFGIICWLKSGRYLLKPCPNKRSALGLIESHKLMGQNTNMFEIPKIVKFYELLTLESVKNKITYYTIAPLNYYYIPYIYSMHDKVDYFKLFATSMLSYIFGIINDIDSNYLYIENSEIKIICICNSEPLKLSKKFQNTELAEEIQKIKKIYNFDEIKNLLESLKIKVDHNFLVRIEEILTFIY